MTNFKNKSDFNFDGSKLLIDRSLFSPSIHCLYYGCVQLIIHLLITKYGYTEDSIKIAIQNLKDNKLGGTHTFYNTTIYRIAYSANKYTALDLQRSLSSLKISREESDYESKEITYDICHLAEQKKDKILEILKKM
ncbi:MAG: hypothetical protein M0Q51_03230 [Bacteroidales bacterium]|nr:hypothetical protein [Bacteroidales bacterium]